jgi:hypothetical protein
MECFRHVSKERLDRLPFLIFFVTSARKESPYPAKALEFSRPRNRFTSPPNVASLNPVGKGTALGLCTVYGVVRQSAGYIQVESDPGRGTCFELSFPLVAAPQTLALSFAPHTASALPESATILLVDDETVLVHAPILCAARPRSGQGTSRADRRSSQRCCAAWPFPPPDR